MCGSYGDPAAGKNTLDIMRWFRTINPNMTLGMNTNGAIQSTFWWHELGRLHTQPLDYCVFSIDGLEDTNSVYRKNVDWAKLMHNAKAYINAGGSAHWDMLVYRHNQHQVEACEQLARNMGFKWFRAKVSRRGFTDHLQAPQHWALPVTQGGRIDCHVLKEKSMYIDAQGRVSPCCWQGSRQINFVQDDLITLKSTWRTTTPNTVCASACSVPNRLTVFEDQWRKDVELIPSRV
jgi:MoaA/NifB/PqqE/SkfB family radical SAM enzyme